MSFYSFLFKISIKRALTDQIVVVSFLASVLCKMSWVPPYFFSVEKSKVTWYILSFIGPVDIYDSKVLQLNYGVFAHDIFMPFVFIVVIEAEEFTSWYCWLQQKIWWSEKYFYLMRDCRKWFIYLLISTCFPWTLKKMLSCYKEDLFRSHPSKLAYTSCH